MTDLARRFAPHVRPACYAAGIAHYAIAVIAGAFVGVPSSDGLPTVVYLQLAAHAVVCLQFAVSALFFIAAGANRT